MARLPPLSIFKTSSEKETFSLAEKFSASLSGGEIIVLSGPIGAGKTIFVKGAAKGLGCGKSPISSSFNLMRFYKGKKLILRHFDLFRLEEREMKEIPFEEYFTDDSVVMIEWPEAGKKIYSRFPHFSVEIELLGSGERKITLAAHKARTGNKI